jgi:hypothetical protein
MDLSFFRKSYGRHHDLVDRYVISVSQMTTYMFHLFLLYDQNCNSTWINGTFFLLDSNAVYQNINRHKTKDRVIRTTLKTGGDLCVTSTRKAI